MAARVLVAIAVVAIAAIVALYLEIIQAQGGAPPDTPLVVPFVAGFLILMAALLGASLVAPPSLSPALRAGASAGLLALGVLAAMSIGVAVLIAAGLAIASTVLAFNAQPRARSAATAAVAVVVSVALLGAGFEVALNHVVCPPSGESGGSTASFLGHGSSYECRDGVLTVQR